MQLTDKDPKLAKIVQLAKLGVGGEKDNALRILKELCVTNSIDFAEVMGDDITFREYIVGRYRNEQELRIVSQVCFKFGSIDDGRFGVRYNKYRKVVMVETTPAKYAEVAYAYPIYIREYRRLLKQTVEDLAGAFIGTNRLYQPDYGHEPEDDQPDTRTNDEIAAAWCRAQLSMGISPVRINKALGDGDN